MRTAGADRAASRQSTTQVPFETAYERDGIAVVAPTSSPMGGWGTGNGGRTGARGARAVGAFVVKDGDVRWQPTVDLTRVLTTAEIVIGAVVVASRFARRPSGPKARVTMGPGGWVSMKGGEVAVRPGSRPWARPRRVTTTTAGGQAPVWARVLSAVPLQSLLR